MNNSNSNNSNGDIQIDKQRINLLLTINTLLLHKFTQNHDQNLLKRLHANLTCIGELSEKFNNGGVATKHIFPTILSPPNDVPELADLYVKLQQLFPEGVQIIQKRTLLLRQEQLKRQFAAQGQQQPGIQGMQGQQPQNIQQLQQQQQQQQQQGMFNQGNAGPQQGAGQSFW